MLQNKLKIKVTIVHSLKKKFYIQEIEKEIKDYILCILYNKKFTIFIIT